MSGMEFYVSTRGNDAWSGRLSEPNDAGADGPFATLARARDAVREQKQSGRMAGPITVRLRGGRYHLRGPVIFTPDDSAPVTYAAYPGEQPIIDGGHRIEGWRVEAANGRQAWVADVPEAATGAWKFRQLFVNGERRLRPRLPREGFHRIEDVPGRSTSDDPFSGTNQFRGAPGQVRNWHNLGDVEAVVLHFWVEERMPITSYDEATRIVTSSRTSAMLLRDDWSRDWAKYYVENIFEELSEPGEWYLDSPAGKVYYIPFPGEEPATAEVYAPVAEQLIRLEGKPDEGRFVEFLRFEGLGFEHTSWNAIPGDRASSSQAAHLVPGAIFMTGARYCAIEGCRVAHVGGYAVEVADGCMANRIVGNELADMGAGGVKVNGSNAGGPPARRTSRTVVTDNHIHHGGRVFHSAVGVLSMHASDGDLSHNHIHDLYYTGISCGWVWGYNENVSKNNRIERNHIHAIGHRWLSDMGGIYTLGVQPGTVLRGNLIHDVEAWGYGGWAIYPDEGSSHLIIEDNIGYRTSHVPFHQHYGRENTVRNNIFAFGAEGVIQRSRLEPHNSLTFEKNILLADGTPIFAGHHLEEGGIRSDTNLMWDLSRDVVPHPSQRLDQWRALGYDRASVVADPGFRDPKNGDFALPDDSPAFALGFRRIDLGDVGPRPKEKRG